MLSGDKGSLLSPLARPFMLFGAVPEIARVGREKCRTRTQFRHAGERHAARWFNQAGRHARALCTPTCGGGALTGTFWGWATRGPLQKHAQSVCTHPCGEGARFLGMGYTGASAEAHPVS